MTWKKWPYWLKGGVIGLGLPVISFLLFSSCIYFTTPPFWNENLASQCLRLYFTVFPFLFPPYGEIYVEFLVKKFPVLIPIPIVFVYIFLGVLIGIIIDFFKKKRTPQ